MKTILKNSKEMHNEYYKADPDLDYIPEPEDNDPWPEAGEEEWGQDNDNENDDGWGDDPNEDS